MPELIDEALAAVGEKLVDWLTLTTVDPAYRAWFPDGSRLDVIADPDRMAVEVARVCGPAEADGYRRFVEYARRLWRLERADFIERNFDSPRDLLTPTWAVRPPWAPSALQARVDRSSPDPRTARLRLPAMYAGCAPRGRPLRGIAYLDSCRRVLSDGGS